MTLSYELTSQLVTALMQEADIDLNKEVEQYAKSTEYDSEDCRVSAEVACDLDVPFGGDDPDLQSDTEEALTCALLTFFDSLPESMHKGIARAIRRFVTCPDERKLDMWKELVNQRTM